MVVDFIMSTTFGEIDLNQDPCIVPACGHIITIESMDGHMSMSDFYSTDAEGSIVALKNSAAPFSASEIKSCPTCRSSLRKVNRYSRIVRRALIDEATKKFIVWANMQFIPLATKLEVVEKELRHVPPDQARGLNLRLAEAPVPQTLSLTKSRNNQIAEIGTYTRKDTRLKKIIGLRRDIKKFLRDVDETEQPFGRIFDLAKDARRHRGIEIELDSKVEILQVRNRILATVLLIRCDYSIMSTFLNDQKDDNSSNLNVTVELSTNRKECEMLIAESASRNQPANMVEGHLYWARFFALERTHAEPGTELSALLEAARFHVQSALDICDQYPGQTAGMKQEATDVEKMLGSPHSTHQSATKRKQQSMQPWHMISVGLVIGTTVPMVTHSRLGSAVCRCRLRNVHSVARRLGDGIMRLLRVLDGRRTWIVNLVQ